MKLVLFDADGTLIDSQSIIHESMRLTFLRFDYDELLPEHTRAIIGLTLDRAIATILQRGVDDEILAMTAEYKQIYLQLAAIEEMQSRPFNGVPQFVRKLATREDVLLGIVTGKSRRGVQKLLETVHFENLFVTSRCADDCPSKPHPAMVLECCEEVGVSAANTLVVGDTGFDMEMAVSAGATAMGVAWGYHPLERMLAAGAHCIAHSANHLEMAVDQWMSGDLPVLESPMMAAGPSLRTHQYA
jgi:phosphoglycolate phosphatase